MLARRITKLLSVLALTAALGAGTADAANITFDFQGSGGIVSGSGYGNTRSYTVGGITVTASAWGVTGASNTQFRTAQLGWWSGAGFGICARNEGTGCSNPEHQVDNSGAREYVLFRFSQAVDPTQVGIDPYGTYDRDVEYFVGNATTSVLTNLAPSAASLGTIGLGGRFTSLSTPSSDGRLVAIEGGMVTALLIGAGALNSDGFDNIIDRFKIETLTISTGPSGAPDPSAVPVPATIALLGGALVALRALRNHKA